MLTFLRNLTVRNLLVAEAPSLAISIVIAEVFYKFHSFTFECIAFLATWAVVGFMTTTIGRTIGLLPAREQHA
ncbi:hypothetical protein BH18CHL1_BH18CHL1_07730 [soil metagenome]|nr:hypothetical protein [Chloroflexota bacterium]